MNEVIRFNDANSLLAHLESVGMPMRAPIDVDSIAEFLGLAVIDDPTLEARDSIGEISFDGVRPTIRMNPIQNSFRPRRRFTLAHEIGHFCLHRDGHRSGFIDNQSTMSRTASYWDKSESEANNFAAQLLMPVSLIAEAGNSVLSRFKIDSGSADAKIPQELFVEQMAEKFDVSTKAMEYRLLNLGILQSEHEAA